MKLKNLKDLEEEKEKELILWKNNLGKDGRKLDRKGFHKNPDFEFIVNGYIQALHDAKALAIKWAAYALKKKKNPFTMFLDFHTLVAEDLLK